MSEKERRGARAGARARGESRGIDHFIQPTSRVLELPITSALPKSTRFSLPLEWETWGLRHHRFTYAGLIPYDHLSFVYRNRRVSGIEWGWG